LNYTKPPPRPATATATCYINLRPHYFFVARKPRRDAPPFEHHTVIYDTVSCRHYLRHRFFAFTAQRFNACSPNGTGLVLANAGDIFLDTEF
jgi:hypothetical protein